MEERPDMTQREADALVELLKPVAEAQIARSLSEVPELATFWESLGSEQQTSCCRLATLLYICGFDDATQMDKLIARGPADVGRAVGAFDDVEGT